MIDREFLDLFVKYIKEDASKDTWLEKGLVENAPITAVMAFEQYRQMEELAQKEGIEI